MLFFLTRLVLETSAILGILSIDVKTIFWNKDLTWAGSYWAVEALASGKVSKNFVLLFCHGEYERVDDSTEWWIYPDPPMTPRPLTVVIQELMEEFPQEDIVLIICNELGVDITRPPDSKTQIFYAKKRVWTMPDSSPWDSHERVVGSGPVGSFSEFSRAE